MHAAIEFALAHPHVPHEVLILLSAEDELELAFLVDCAYRVGVETTTFHEPDLDGSLTAVAISDSLAARRLTAGFPLALASIPRVTETSRQEYQRQWRQDHPEKVKEYRATSGKRWKDANSDLDVEYHRRYREAHPERVALQRAKSRAALKGVRFELAVEDLPPIPTHCPALGTPLDRSSPTRRNSPSLDRIVPELGYVPGNVQWLSYLANVMKQDASAEELRSFASWITRGGGD